MISKEVRSMLLHDGGEELMILSENVANLNCNHHLYHAMLVLSQVKYNSIPVLDNESRIRGLISMPMIMNAIMGISSMRFDEMEKIKIEEVMDKKVPIIHDPSDLELILNKLINHSFICVADEYGHFEGIITRKEVLSRVNHLVHEMHNQFDFFEKALSSSEK